MYSRKGLKQSLREKAEELGRPPSSSEVRKDEGLAAPSTFYNHLCGDDEVNEWPRVIEAAGLDASRSPARYGNSKLVKHLQANRHAIKQKMDNGDGS